eukprot:Opistho-1_new@89328
MLAAPMECLDELDLGLGRTARKHARELREGVEVCVRHAIELDRDHDGARHVLFLGRDDVHLSRDGGGRLWMVARGHVDGNAGPVALRHGGGRVRARRVVHSHNSGNSHVRFNLGTSRVVRLRCDGRVGVVRGNDAIRECKHAKALGRKQLHFGDDLFDTILRQRDNAAVWRDAVRGAGGDAFNRALHEHAVRARRKPALVGGRRRIHDRHTLQHCVKRLLRHERELIRSQRGLPQLSLRREHLKRHFGGVAHALPAVVLEHDRRRVAQRTGNKRLAEVIWHCAGVDLCARRVALEKSALRLEASASNAERVRRKHEVGGHHLAHGNGACLVRADVSDFAKRFQRRQFAYDRLLPRHLADADGHRHRHNRRESLWQNRNRHGNRVQDDLVISRESVGSKHDESENAGDAKQHKHEALHATLQVRLLRPAALRRHARGDKPNLRRHPREHDDAVPAPLRDDRVLECEVLAIAEGHFGVGESGGALLDRHALSPMYSALI